VQQKACLEAESPISPLAPSTIVVFPEQDLPPANIAFNFPLASIPQPTSVPIVFTGCIDYRFSGTEEHHQTGFAYQVIDFRNNVRSAGGATISGIELVQFSNPLSTHQYFFAN
jgi:hypothetical protein